MIRLDLFELFVTNLLLFEQQQKTKKKKKKTARHLTVFWTLWRN